MSLSLLTALRLTAGFALASLASAQADTYDGLITGGPPGYVNTSWSSDFGLPLSADVGIPSGTHVDGQTMSANVYKDWGGPAFGIVSSDLQVDVPAAGSPLSSAVTHYHAVSQVQNLSGGYGMSTNMGAQSYLVCTPHSSVVYYDVHWRVEYTNSIGGFGTLLANCYVGGGQLLNGNWSHVAPFVEEGTAAGIAPGGTIVLDIGSHLYQGQDVAGFGELTYDVWVSFSSCAVPAADVSYGAGKAGTFGVPGLSGESPMTLGGGGDVLITGALPGAPAWLVAGLSELSVPFKGGMLLTSPDFVIPMVIPVGGAGSVPVPTLDFDGTLGGITLYHQLVISDPGAAGAPFAMSNGLSRTLGF